MEWKLNRREAVFLQLADRLRYDILKGKYQEGEQIPSVRQLAYDAAVNPNTMQKALSILESEGILCSRGTVGRFVTSDVATLDAAKDRVRRITVRKWMREAEQLGISTDELINYIKEETKT